MIDSNIEEIFLPDVVLSSDVFLPEMLNHGNEHVRDVNDKEGENNLLDVNKFDACDEIYSMLKIAEKPERVDFKEYFKSTPEIFKIASVDYYKPLTHKQYQQFENKCENFISQAKSKWNSPKLNYKIAELDDALGTLKSIFRTKAATEAYSEEIRRTLITQIYNFLNQKLKDGILELSEIQELIEIAVSIHLVSDSEKGRKTILDWIKKRQEQKHFKIESYNETFVRNVKNKTDIQRMDTDSVRNSLFNEYKILARINSEVFDCVLDTDEKLCEIMSEILRNNNLLISNSELFIADFLEPEISRKGEFFFSAPLSSEYYYYLKGTANNKYELTEEQWRVITDIRGISADKDFTVAFIMGNKKESSVQGIARLIIDNPEISSDRILAGDLETYFEHIGRKDISSNIKSIKSLFKNERHQLVVEVCNMLKKEFGLIDLADEGKKEETIESLINENVELKTLVTFVVKNKSDESLINKITKDEKTTQLLEKFLLSRKKKSTYAKFLMNVLNELLFENDITQYAYSFMEISFVLQNKLVELYDCFAFLFVYESILHNALLLKLFQSEDEIIGFNECKAKMTELYELELSKIKTIDKHKSKFNIFHKGEK